jgi:hypothetical protein
MEALKSIGNKNIKVHLMYKIEDKSQKLVLMSTVARIKATSELCQRKFGLLRISELGKQNSSKFYESAEVKIQVFYDDKGKLAAVYYYERGKPTKYVFYRNTQFIFPLHCISNLCAGFVN